MARKVVRAVRRARCACGVREGAAVEGLRASEHRTICRYQRNSSPQPLSPSLPLPAALACLAKTIGSSTRRNHLQFFRPFSRLSAIFMSTHTHTHTCTLAFLEVPSCPVQVAALYMCTRLIVNLTQLYSPFFVLESISLSKVSGTPWPPAKRRVAHCHMFSCQCVATPLPCPTDQRCHCPFCDIPQQSGGDSTAEVCQQTPGEEREWKSNLHCTTTPGGLEEEEWCVCVCSFCVDDLFHGTGSDLGWTVSPLHTHT